MVRMKYWKDIRVNDGEQKISFPWSHLTKLNPPFLFCCKSTIKVLARMQSLLCNRFYITPALLCWGPVALLNVSALPQSFHWVCFFAANSKWDFSFVNQKTGPSFHKQIPEKLFPRSRFAFLQFIFSFSWFKFPLGISFFFGKIEIWQVHFYLSEMEWNSTRVDSFFFHPIARSNDRIGFFFKSYFGQTLHGESIFFLLEMKHN